MKKLFYVVLLGLILQSCGYSVDQTIEKRWLDPDSYLYTEIILDGEVVKSWCDKTISDSVKQLRYNQAMDKIIIFEQVDSYIPTEKEDVVEVFEEEYEY